MDLETFCTFCANSLSTDYTSATVIVIELVPRATPSILQPFSTITSPTSGSTYRRETERSWSSVCDHQRNLLSRPCDHGVPVRTALEYIDRKIVTALLTR